MRQKYNLVTRREDGVSYLCSQEDPLEFMVSSNREQEVLEEAYWRIERHPVRGTYVRGMIYKPVRRKVTLHQFLTGYTGKIVDHKNRNTLDCTDNNLRFASVIENRYNSKDLDYYSNKIPGVYYHVSKDCWVAQISRNGKNITIASRKSKLSTILAYDEYILSNNLENLTSVGLGRYSLSDVLSVCHVDILKTKYPHVYKLLVE